MLRSFVFHAKRKLNDQFPCRRQLHQFAKSWIVELIAVIVGMQPDARHFMLLSATPQIFAPVRQLEIDGAKRKKESRAVSTAILRQPRIGARNIFMEDSVEASRPGLHDAPLPQALDQFRRFVSRQSPEGPAREIHVHVDNHTLRPFAFSTGARSRWRFARRTNRRADSGTSAPMPLSSCEAKLRPAASLPLITRSAPSSRTAISTQPAVGSKPAIQVETFLAGRNARMPISQSPPVCTSIKEARGCRIASSARSEGVDSPGPIPLTFNQVCCRMGTFMRTARSTIGSTSGVLQRRATHSLTPTIGPSRTQRSNSWRLNARWFGFK